MHAKFHDLKIDHSGRKVCDQKEKKGKKNNPKNNEHHILPVIPLQSVQKFLFEKKIYRF